MCAIPTEDDASATAQWIWFSGRSKGWDEDRISRVVRFMGDRREKRTRGVYYWAQYWGSDDPVIQWRQERPDIYPEVRV